MSIRDEIASLITRDYNWAANVRTQRRQADVLSQVNLQTSKLAAALCLRSFS
jgi:hypothetical protein